MPPSQKKSAPSPVAFTINGHLHRFIARSPERPLLSVLREELGLTGTHYGCGQGQCGACTVLIDGQPERACQVTLAALDGRQVITIEGIGTPTAPHPVQAAFIAEQAAQCGYCTPGMVMEAVALLKKTPDPDLDAIRTGLSGHLCRCGSHQRILRAVKRAAGAGS